MFSATLPLRLRSPRFQARRRKMIWMTSAFLTWGLTHYPSGFRIPTRSPHQGRFGQTEAETFWDRLSIA